MRASWSRILLVLIVVAVVAAALATVLAPPQVSADLGKVTRGPLRVTVESEGKTRVKNLYDVTAPVSGRLLRVQVKAGDVVKAGEVVAIIEPAQPQFLNTRSLAEGVAKVRSAEAARDLAKADLQRAKAAEVYARADLARTRALSATGASALKTLEQAELLLKTREAELAVAEKTLQVREHEVKLAEAGLLQPGEGGNLVEASATTPTCIEVVAPVSGQVFKVVQESETVVNPGQLLMHIGNLQELEVALEMLSQDAVKVRVGAEALIEGWGGAVLRGKVRRVEPFGFTKTSALGIEEQRVNVIVDFADPPAAWEALAHGFRVDTKVIVWEQPSVLKVPMGGLFRQGNAWAVFVVVDGKAQLRRVAIGHTTTFEAEVLGDLAEGDLVVLHPSDLIRDGTRVKARSVM